MILSDGTIQGLLHSGTVVIDPKPYDWQLQPASVDLTLGNEFQSPYSDEKMIQNSVMIGPRECLLATTAERIELPDDLVGRVEGKSSWGRKFLAIHVTAGYIDPGFCGTVTLELVNFSNISQIVRAGDAIAQISFHALDAPVMRPYGSPGLNNHYQGQEGVTPSAMPWG